MRRVRLQPRCITFQGRLFDLLRTCSSARRGRPLQTDLFRRRQWFAAFCFCRDIAHATDQVRIPLVDLLIPLHGPVQRIGLAFAEPDPRELLAQVRMRAAVTLEEFLDFVEQLRALRAIRRRTGPGVGFRGMQSVERSLADQFHAACPQQERIQQLGIDRGIAPAGLQVLDGRPDNVEQLLRRGEQLLATAIGQQVIFPETGIHHPFHARHAVRLCEQLNRLAEMVTRFSKQHATHAAVEIFRFRGGGVPGTLGSPGVSVPLVALQCFAVVLPFRIEHAQCALFGAVADEVLDILRGHAEIGEYPAPVADARTDKELVAGLGERSDLVVETVGRSVSPRQHDGVLGNLVQLGLDAAE